MWTSVLFVVEGAGFEFTSDVAFSLLNIVGLDPLVRPLGRVLPELKPESQHRDEEKGDCLYTPAHLLHYVRSWPLCLQQICGGESQIFPKKRGKKCLFVYVCVCVRVCIYR